MHPAVGQLERLLHLGDALDLGVAGERVLINGGGVADEREDGRAGAVDRVDMHAVGVGQPIGELLDVFRGRAVFHDEDHNILPFESRVCGKMNMFAAAEE